MKRTASAQPTHWTPTEVYSNRNIALLVRNPNIFLKLKIVVAVVKIAVVVAKVVLES